MMLDVIGPASEKGSRESHNREARCDDSSRSHAYRLRLSRAERGPLQLFFADKPTGVHLLISIAMRLMAFRSAV
jgi:hypothetical protein